jgi:hypothetical protein
MNRMDASRREASALRLRFSNSLARRRQRFSQAIVRSLSSVSGERQTPLTPRLYHSACAPGTRGVGGSALLPASRVSRPSLPTLGSDRMPHRARRSAANAQGASPRRDWKSTAARLAKNVTQKVRPPPSTTSAPIIVDRTIDVFDACGVGAPPSRGEARMTKRLLACSTSVSVRESRSAMISGHEPTRPSFAMRSSKGFLV